MKRIILLFQLLFLIGAAISVCLIRSGPLSKEKASTTTASGSNPYSDAGIIQLLASGKQAAAERKVQNPKNPQQLFWKAVLLRSRFDNSGAIPLFIKVMKEIPDSPEGLASACIVGIDLSNKATPALHYFNALMILAGEHPDSVPIHWMAGVMSRTMTRDDPTSRGYTLPESMKRQVLFCGIDQYERTLSLLSPGKGPVLIHQTLANLYDDVEDQDSGAKYHAMAVSMERQPWSLHAAAVSLMQLGRNEEALPLIKEAIAMEENEIWIASSIAFLAKEFRKITDPLKGSFPALRNISKALEPLDQYLTPPVELPRYYGIYGYTLLNMGRRDEALAAYEKAFAINPTLQNTVALCMYLSRCMGLYDKALKYSRQGMINEPEDTCFPIWNARFGVLTGEPGAADRLQKAGDFDFRGNVCPNKPPTSDPWFSAVRRGDFAKVREMIPHVDINTPEAGDDHQTALMTAAQIGWEPMVVDLLKAGAKTDLVDINGDTALHYSSQFNQLRIVKLLLDAGASTDIQDKWHQTPLIMASCHKGWEIVRLILEKKPDVNLASPHHGTPLFCAAGWGQFNIEKTLIAHGADPNIHRQERGDTPLMNTIAYDHISCINPLLAAGAEINACDNMGRTALSIAISRHLDIPLVRLLLEKGTNPSIPDKNGITPITKARLLGYEELAVMMEDKASHKEPLQFPQLDLPEPSSTAEGNNASLCTLPYRMAMGLFPKPPGNSPPNYKKDALRDLESEFGITSKRELEKSLSLLEWSQALLLEAGKLGMEPKNDWLQDLLTKAVRTIDDSCEKKCRNEAAWTYSRVILLAKLGTSAGFLNTEESTHIITNASKIIADRFSSWDEFSESFLLGIRLHEEWEQPRYKNIFCRIVESGIAWPEAVPHPPIPESQSSPLPNPATPSPTPEPASSDKSTTHPETDSAPEPMHDALPGATS